MVSVLTGIIFGLLPAIRMSRTDIGGSLKDGGRAISGPRTRMQSALVIGEMAMALVLLVGAGLMCRTLVQLWKVDPGFDPRNVSRFRSDAATFSEESNSGRGPRGGSANQRDSPQRAGSGGRVLAWWRHAHGMDNETGFLLEGQELPTSELGMFRRLWNTLVEPEYLNTMRIPLLRGRFLSDGDNENSARVVVIDAGFAQQYFPGQDPIGKHIRTFEFDSDSDQRVLPLLIVGVVGHVNQWGLADDGSRPLQAEMYRPIMQNGPVDAKGLAQGLDVFVRSKTALAPGAFFESIRQKLLASNRDMIVYDNESEEASDGRTPSPASVSLSSCWAHSQGWRCCWLYGNLWRAVVPGRAAYTGNRCAHGARERNSLMYCAWCCKTERA